MHVTTKEVDDQGVHILTSTVEADGPLQLASEKAKLSAEVIAVRRTESGGVFLQTALTITEPEAEKAAPVSTAAEQAAAYLISKGLSDGEAKAAVARFGVARIQERQRADEKSQHEALDQELDALLKK